MQFLALYAKPDGGPNKDKVGDQGTSDQTFRLRARADENPNGGDCQQVMTLQRSSFNKWSEQTIEEHEPERSMLHYHIPASRMFERAQVSLVWLADARR